MKTMQNLRPNPTFGFLVVLALLYMAPLLLVLMNSFKGRFFISDTPFAFPDLQTFVRLNNYIAGL
jgi:raffinose/stachyose/melibiose transport system permease protein